MKIKLKFLTFLVFALFISCNPWGFNTKIDIANHNCISKYSKEKGLELVFTNTSKNKYLEATIKCESKNGSVWTFTKKLKPGEIEKDCFPNLLSASVVGELEITNEQN
jgi:hypothetical protein